MSHKNSLEAWHGEVKPTLRRRQLQVLKVYQRIGQGTATDIMAITGRPRNVIHPRVGELRDLGYLEEIGDKIIDGRKHAILRVTEKGDKIDTSGVEDITPAHRYYSKEDYRRFCREFYDFARTEASSEETDKLHARLTSFLATKK